MNLIDTQQNLESTIGDMVAHFVENPYAFFTEADAVIHLSQLILDDPYFGKTYKPLDNFETSLIHREYPTFFRFDDNNPTARLSPVSGARRGHSDLVILNPDLIQSHKAETITNRNVEDMVSWEYNPFEAVIEFKLDNIGWSRGRTEGVMAELGKLMLSDEAPLRYFVVLMRYTAPTTTRWDKYWPVVQEGAGRSILVNSLFAVNWISTRIGSEVFKYGAWLK